MTAHLLIASLETDEVRDLGTGCLPGWSADGRKIAFSKHGQGVFIRNFEGNTDSEELIDIGGFGIQFSPDGLNLAYLKHANIMTYNLKSGLKRPLFPVDKLVYQSLEHNFAWSPDSQRICFRGRNTNGNFDIGIVSFTENGSQLRVRCDGIDAQADFAWHPDGRRVVFPRTWPGRPKQLYEFDPDTDTPAVRVLSQPKERNNGGMCWSRDGKIFVYMSTR